MPMPQNATHQLDRGLELFPASVAGHVVQGVAIGALVVSGDLGLMAWGILWFLGYIAYQGLSMVRKGDSAGLDVMDAIIGLPLGALVEWNAQTGYGVSIADALAFIVWGSKLL